MKFQPYVKKICKSLTNSSEINYIPTNYTMQLHKRNPLFVRPVVNISKFLEYFWWISVGGLLAKKVNSDPYFSLNTLYNTTPYTNQMVEQGCIHLS